MTTVAAVIVTWNRKDLLRRCLHAVRAQTRPPERIVLIDNASADGTPDMLRTEGFLDDPRLRHLRMEENLGGAGGFAAGIADARRAGADWIWLFDDDTVPASCSAWSSRSASRSAPSAARRRSSPAA